MNKIPAIKSPIESENGFSVDEEFDLCRFISRGYLVLLKRNTVLIEVGDSFLEWF